MGLILVFLAGDGPSLLGGKPVLSCPIVDDESLWSEAVGDKDRFAIASFEGEAGRCGQASVVACG